MKTYIVGKLQHSKFDTISYDECLAKLDKAETWFIDTETTHELNLDKLYAEYIGDKNITPSLKERADKHVNNIVKDIATDPKRNVLRLVQIEANKEIFLIDAYNCDIKKIADMIPHKLICGYNLKFDLSVFFVKFGVYPKEVLDLWLTYLLIEHSRAVGRFSSGLGVALENHLDIKVDKEEQRSNWQGELSEDQLNYAQKDVLYLRQLAGKHIKYLNDYSINKVDKPYFKHLVDYVAILEMKFLWSIIIMEYYGIPINKQALYEELDKLYPEKFALDNKLIESMNLNYNSPQQVVEFLNARNIPVQNATKGELKQYAEHQIVKDIMRAKEITKEITTIEDYLNKHSVNGRIYPTFWQLTAKSGRLSSSNPNAQQIPRAIKNKIYGKNIISLDYPAIEMRIMAEVTKDPKMIQAFKDNIDIHKQTASLIANKPIDEVTKEERQGAKPANFLLLYGGGAETFRQGAFVQYGIRYSISEAQAIKNKFLSAYKKIGEYHKRNGDLINNLGTMICYTLAGRRMLSNLFTLSNNLPVQGTGADMLKYACVLFYDKVKDHTKMHIVSVVHDEIIVEYADGYKDEAMKILKQSMEESVNTFIKSFKTEVCYE